MEAHGIPWNHTSLGIQYAVSGTGFSRGETKPVGPRVGVKASTGGRNTTLCYMKR